MNTKLILTLLFCLAGILCPLSLVAQQQKVDTKLETKLQDKLDQFVNEKGFPGATLAIVMQDGSRIGLASGVEDTTTKKKMTPQSLMFCGSTGKTFASAVALHLVSKDKIKLDDLAKKYFSNEEDEWFTKLPNAESMTIRSLMNHTSGLPRYVFSEEFIEDLNEEPLKSRSPKDGLAYLIGLEPTHEVGKGWGYSDSNYLVLGLIIERVTGKEFYDVANTLLLKPQKLSHTIPSTQPKLPGLIQGHIGSANPFQLPKMTVKNETYCVNPDFEWCGGGYVTNSVDLAAWMHALHSGKVLDKEIYEELIQPVDFRTGRPAKAGYGLGSFVWQTRDNGLYYGHAGLMPGYLTQIEYSAKHGFAVALQTNTDEGMGRGLHQFVQEVAQLLIK